LGTPLPLFFIVRETSFADFLREGFVRPTASTAVCCCFRSSWALDAGCSGFGRHGLFVCARASPSKRSVTRFAGLPHPVAPRNHVVCGVILRELSEVLQRCGNPVAGGLEVVYICAIARENVIGSCSIQRRKVRRKVSQRQSNVVRVSHPLGAVDQASDAEAIDNSADEQQS
jgi:hypothetical protein